MSLTTHGNYTWQFPLVEDLADDEKGGGSFTQTLMADGDMGHTTDSFEDKKRCKFHPY